MEEYLLLGVLGEGGMGIVHRALQVALKREVAVKLLRPGARDPTEDLVRFRRETEILIGLSHPNIVKVFDAGKLDGQLFLAMELVDAPDLARLLKQKTPFSAEQVVSILDQVLDALEYIHSKDLVHRDVKPNNIMLEPAGRAVLMDFGLAKGLQDTFLTAPDCILGTPYYLSPEMAGGSPATAASDLWALGVTAYELLSGSRPFAGSSFSALMTAVTSIDPAPLAGVRPGLAAWVARCLEKNPRNRHLTATEAREALRRTEVSPTRAIPASRPPGEPHIVEPAALRLAHPPPNPQASPLRQARRRHARPVSTRILAATALALGVMLCATYQLWFHRMPVSPRSPPESDGRPVTVTVPESPSSRIRRLAIAVRQSHLAAEGAANQLWKRILSRTTGWSFVDYRHQLRLQVAAHPDVLAPLSELVLQVRSNSGLGKAWSSIRRDLGSLLMDRAMPPALREEALAAVWSLDRLDCVANFLGQEPVFGTRKAVEPAMEVSCRPAASDRTVPGDGCLTLFPAPGEKPRSLFPPMFAPAVGEVRGNDFLKSNVDLLHEGLGSAEPDVQLRFLVPAGSPAPRCLRLRITRLPPQSYLRLTPPGWKTGLPVRHPDGLDVEKDTPYELTVHLRGALSGTPGEWSAEHLLTIEDTPSHGCVVHGIDIPAGPDPR